MKTEPVVVLVPKEYYSHAGAFALLRNYIELWQNKPKKLNVLLDGKSPAISIFDAEVFIKLFNDEYLPSEVKRHWVFFAELPLVFFVSSAFVARQMVHDKVPYKHGMNMIDVIKLYQELLIK